MSDWPSHVRAQWRALQKNRDPRVWISVVSESQLESQIAASSASNLPLQGLTFAIKDNIDLAGLPTTAGCPAFACDPPDDAHAVALLIHAGAIPLGKTAMDQFATGLVGVRSPHGPCPNVFNAEYISGGSSSGSAVAVARGEADFSLGTDTAGSGRVPAALNGLIGCKPTCGAISTRGVVPACRTLDCVSTFAKTVALTQRVTSILRSFDPADPFARPFESAATLPAEFRFAVPDLHHDLFADAIAQLEAIGGRKTIIDDTPFREAAALLYQGPWVAERYAAVGAFIEAHPEAIDPTVREIILAGKNPTASAAFQAAYRLAELRRQTEPLWRDFDCFVLPTVTDSYRISEVLADPIRLNSFMGITNNFVNLLDLAAVTVPTGHFPSGPGFGINLIAPAFHDDALLSLAARLRHEPAPPQSTAAIQLAVVGAHLRGQPLHHQLTSLNARFIQQTSTSAAYRLHSLPNTAPPKPGLARVPAGGAAIEIEIYELTPAAFGKFTAAVPPPLCIGNVELASGAWVKGFLCEPAALQGARDITQFGGWRAWLQSLQKPMA